ncbi:MAG: hypothetical protein CSA81_05620 [Acidobacteria bacterium]|nr:MAG: hypothetical protein CSA81_05620 [Acidobacteriota bacterium]
MRVSGFKMSVYLLIFSTLSWAQVMDVLITDAGNQPAIIYKNNGAAHFEEVLVELDQNNSLDARTVALGDFDSDGDLDALIGYRGANSVWKNDGYANFSDTGQRLGKEDTVTIKLGDLDADGDLDAIFFNWGGPNLIWLNDGEGNFSERDTHFVKTDNEGNELDPDKLDTRAADLGDLDGDGDLDVVLVNINSSGAGEIWLNDGSAGFTKSDTEFSYLNSEVFDLTLGDFDSDGDLDMFMAAIDDEPNLVYWNDGAAVFSDSGQRLGSARSAYAVVGDLDLDGDLDVFVANSDYHCDGANHVWFNNGEGTFTGGTFFGNAPSLSAALADFDGDGDLDAVVGNRGTSGEANRVWINNGLGEFSDNGQRLGGGRTSAVAVGNLRNLETKAKSRLLLIPETDIEMHLVLVNSTRSSQPVKVTAFSKEGVRLRSKVLQTLPGEQQKVSLSEFMGASSLSLSESSEVRGFIRTAAHSVFNEQTQAQKEWRFLYSGPYRSSFKIVNPQVENAEVYVCRNQLRSLQAIVIPPMGSYSIEYAVKGKKQADAVEVSFKSSVPVTIQQTIQHEKEFILSKQPLPR